MSKKHVPPNALARLKRAESSLSTAQGQKWFKKLAEKESRTDCLALQEKRIDLEQKNLFLQSQIEKLLDRNLSHEEREKVFNAASILGMKAMVDGICLVVDCVSDVSRCRIRQPDGSLKSGKRRYGVAQNVTELHDMLIEIEEMIGINLEITHDNAEKSGLFVDEHGVSRSPYRLRPAEAKAEGESETAAEAAQPEIVEASADAVADDDSAIKDPGLQRVQDASLGTMPAPEAQA